MKIAFNPSTVAALITPPNNKDITFDLRGRNIFARGVKFQGTDTWRDIKINNVSIDSNILDLQNGSNTILTNTNGVVTINSTWRPVVDNLTSDSTTSSLSANQGKVLAGLINGHPQIIDMRNYDGNYWHPVTVPLPYRGYNKIKVSVQLNSGDKPSWATHDSGFTCNMEIWATAHGWGATNAETICLNYTYGHCNSNPCGWMQLGYPSLGVLFLRGGARYKVWTDFNATFTPHDKTYTWTSEGGTTQSTGGPYTSCPGLDFFKNIIYANLNGTAENADKLDGYHASYSSNTPWGTIPVITSGGWMDIGKHLEFHRDNTTGSDYSTLLTCTGNYSNIVNLPSESGTLALLSQVVSTSDFNWTNLPGKIVAGNEFNIVNAGYSNNLLINYLPINNRNSSANINTYIMYNGNKSLASVYAYRFKADGQSCMWKDARNYAPFYSTFNGGWEPILDIKTVSGDWSIGSYDSYGNHLVFAFTSDSDFNAGRNGTAQYYLTVGGEFKINTLRLTGSTNANMGVGSTNPQIIFAEDSATQQVALTYTDWDTYRTSKGLKVHSYDGSDDSNVWFEVQGYNYSSGYVKNGSSNAYVLLGGGGHKPLSEFQLGSGSYLPYNGWWSSDSGQDVNNANGMIFAYATHKNTPFSSAWGIITTFDYTYNSAYKFQLAANGYSNAMYYRSRSNDRGGWTSWAQVIDTGNIGSQRVAYATSAGNADTVDGYHASSLVKFYLSPMASNAPADSAKSWFVNTMPSASAAIVYNVPGSEKTIIVGKSSGAHGHMLQLNYDDNYLRMLRYRGGSWMSTNWEKISAGYADSAGSVAWANVTGKPTIPNPTNYYWANIKVSTSSNTQTQPSVNTIYANNWFRSQGNSGWFSESYGGGIYMVDTSWIRTYNGKGFYCDNQIYSSNSIRMSNIVLEHTDEINNSANGGLHLNYRNTGNITLCNGGGAVTIGTTATDIGGNKLYVNGSDFINGASNVKDHVFANGFRHRSHNSNDSVLLAGGGYSQGVPVRYWAIYSMYIGNSSTDITYAKRSGNYNFITSKVWESEGTARFDISFPSGYNKNNTLIFGNGDHRTSSSWKTPVYVTITTSTAFGTESQIRVMISDDASLNTGFANIYFMCMG